MAFVELNGVHKYYENHHVLKDVSLSVEAGHVVALIGRSGSGKSSLLRTINGMTPIDDGEITVDGTVLQADKVNPQTLRSLRLKVGMIFQQFNLFPHLTVAENVMLALTTVKGLTRNAAREVALEKLAKVGLENKLDAYPKQLSGGQQQRVAIARALAMSPKVLLCDEITSALDPELTGEVLAVIKKLAEEGMTIIMATHEMGFAREVSHELVFMAEGRVHEYGKSDELFKNPETAELQKFLGAMAWE
jgi:polar amino acid transport system ATP-binding protein